MTEKEWPLYEVFIRSRAGLSHRHAGSVHAPDDQMALDHARDGIRVNAICPGDIDTPMLATEAEANEIDLDEYLAQAAEQCPNGRIGTPEEVAALILFLASDNATHITGTAIPIDGGGSA